MDILQQWLSPRKTDRIYTISPWIDLDVQGYAARSAREINASFQTESRASRSVLLLLCATVQRCAGHRRSQPRLANKPDDARGSARAGTQGTSSP
jgi:hypothetical protein